MLRVQAQPTKKQKEEKGNSEAKEEIRKEHTQNPKNFNIMIKQLIMHHHSD